ncbi:hypothetical protein [Ferruginibacter sp. HRS2-29]|uniref:hypothetical protein n=1 Tax=Ferruginibacter sp. HRS2-29 TaxID=2487334 RepID=UPI0020CF633F|nr:hypothetical protein [Ferruginibacter sp. HRS2-29]MCP9752452.1 hypothetical protein [Ferruginibacter sp. HRS2-29]
MKKFLVVFTWLVILSFTGIAQTNVMDSNSLKATLEFTNIQLASAAYDNQQFDISVISTDGTVADTLLGVCSIQGENYKTEFDSIIQLQNNFVNLQVHLSGKILVASHPAPFTKQLFKGNVDEASFQSINVGSMSIATVGADKQLVFTFLPESEFEEYKVTYYPATYRVSEITMKTKLPDGAGGYTPGAYNTTTMKLTNFTAISPGTNLFDTSPYILVDGNTLQKQAAYNDYNLVNLMEAQ